MPICSDELGIMGVIDIYKGEQRLLIERKNNLKQIFKGQIYQLWAQYFCMVEMGFTMDDSVVIFDVADNALTKYGCAIHRDQDIVFL